MRAMCLTMALVAASAPERAYCGLTDIACQLDESERESDLRRLNWLEVQERERQAEETRDYWESLQDREERRP